MREERVATFDVHTQVGTFKAEQETKLRDVTMPKNREGEHAFLEALETVLRALEADTAEPDELDPKKLEKLLVKVQKLKKQQQKHLEETKKAEEVAKKAPRSPHNSPLRPKGKARGQAKGKAKQTALKTVKVAPGERSR